MTSIFLDTSGWFAALSPRESRHRAALAVYRDSINRRLKIFTTNLVVAEMHSLVTRFRGPGEGLRFLDSLYQDATHTVVFVNRDLERAAIDRWLRRFHDQQLSLADAVSFEVMRERQIGPALALDAHFALAGFEVLPAGR